MLPTHDAQSLHNALHYTLDINATVINKTIILRPNTSWYTIDLSRQNDVYACLNLNGKKNLYHH